METRGDLCVQEGVALWSCDSEMNFSQSLPGSNSASVCVCVRVRVCVSVCLPSAGVTNLFETESYFQGTESYEGLPV